MVSGGELAYHQLCNAITVEFNDCSKQVSFTILKVNVEQRWKIMNTNLWLRSISLCGTLECVCNEGA